MTRFAVDLALAGCGLTFGGGGAAVAQSGPPLGLMGYQATYPKGKVFAVADGGNGQMSIEVKANVNYNTDYTSVTAKAVVTETLDPGFVGPPQSWDTEGVRAVPELV
jgi:hypothetical protein